MEPSKPCTVYRFYDDELQPLYIGITTCGIERFRQHRKSSIWWEEASIVRVDHFPTVDEALERERELIQELKPKYNVRHNAQNRAARIYAARPATPEGMVWLEEFADEVRIGIHAVRKAVEERAITPDGEIDGHSYYDFQRLFSGLTDQRAS